MSVGGAPGGVSSLRRALQLFALVLAGEAVFALPFVLPRVFRPTVLDVLGIDNTALGDAFGVYGLVAMGAYLLGGPLADRFPVRRMMAVALWGTALGGVVLAGAPGPTTLLVLYGWWGLTTILLFWAGLLRATREWGGPDRQGRAYGLLDGGRGLFAAALSTAAVALFAGSLEATSVGERAAAFRTVVLATTAVTAAAGGVVWFVVPEPAAARVPWSWRAVRPLLSRPTTWLQGLVVLCAYVAYKATDDLSLMARDVLGYDDVQAAGVGALAFWIRPVAAVFAGWTADRVGGWPTVAAGFALLFAGDVLLAVDLGLASWPVFAGFVSTCVAVYALRGVYFALFAEARVPVALTGTAVGLVSWIGYTPDVFMGRLMGVILDGNPGAAGHRLLFAVMAGFALLGLGATLAFGWVSGRAARR